MINTKYIWEVTFNKNPHAFLHVHNFYEIAYFLNGKGKIKYYPNDSIKSICEEIDYDSCSDLIKSNKYRYQTFTFGSNQLFLVPPMIPHDEHHENMPEKVLDIGFELIDENFSLQEPVMINDDNLVFYQIISKINEENQAGKSKSDKYISSLMTQLLIEIERYLMNGNLEHNPMVLAKNYINSNFSKNISIESLANQFGYSPERFRVLFKEKNDISPKDYLIQQRINMAFKLLTETNYSINKISVLCGYDDIAQFSSIFKKKTGMSPALYRKENNANHKVMEQ